VIGPFHHRRHPDGLVDVIDGQARVVVSLLCSTQVTQP